eukprot:GFYU01001577.1.p1 GENE.GFYU01001577.1~~GFYU01001577.1.p1  ORF type:complete len:347 (-),score=92.17 GFYU01001577.1:30-1070(-)
MPGWWDRFCDRSIIFNFGAYGYKRHQKLWKEPATNTLKGKHVVLTGGSSGIGHAMAAYMLEKGAQVTILSRSIGKAESLVEQYGKECKHIKQDMADTETLGNNLKGIDKVDILINNAGGMPQFTHKKGQPAEVIFQSQVFGHYCLTRHLIEEDCLAEGARVIWVASGGMYTQRLDLRDLTYTKKEYNKYTCYANAKRAQVILNEMMAEKFPQYTFSCMHPGWAETPGVDSAMPWFAALMRPFLRTPWEGADTIVWLAETDESYDTGKFWFDREAVETHMSGKTVEKPEWRTQLYDLCEDVFSQTKDGTPYVTVEAQNDDGSDREDDKSTTKCTRRSPKKSAPSSQL